MRCDTIPMKLLKHNSHTLIIRRSTNNQQLKAKQNMREMLITEPVAGEARICSIRSLRNGRIRMPEPDRNRNGSGYHSYQSIFSVACKASGIRTSAFVTNMSSPQEQGKARHKQTKFLALSTPLPAPKKNTRKKCSFNSQTSQYSTV